MKVFHRIDDIQEYRDEMKEILNFFEDNTKEYLLAVIPHGFDARYSDLIRSYTHCKVYQHGFEHVNHVDEGWCDEFPDSLSYEQRYLLVAEGKRILEDMLGNRVDGYVPPWNNTGKGTIKIICELGFLYYSAQENNTIHYKNNKDIAIDVVETYKPSILYKDLEQVYKDILKMSLDRKEIGIMYHFKNISFNDWEIIKEFIKKVEAFN